MRIMLTRNHSFTTRDLDTLEPVLNREYEIIGHKELQELVALGIPVVLEKVTEEGIQIEHPHAY